MTKDEALKLALEALDDLARYADTCELFLKETHPGKADSLRQRVTKSIQAITAIKQALAAPDLQAELVKANSQAEHFEREWYLRGDELEATNRQVEILSDALAESRREVAALKAVQPEQEPSCKNCQTKSPCRAKGQDLDVCSFYVPPPAAQRQWVGLTEDEIDEVFNNWPTYNLDHFEFGKVVEAKVFEKNGAIAVVIPDALNPKDENPAYAAGWNDCRAEMLKGMKP